MRVLHASLMLVLLALLLGTLPAQAATYELEDATYGTAAIKITFDWDGNVSDPLTNFAWSKPLSNGALVQGSSSEPRNLRRSSSSAKDWWGWRS